MEKELEQFREGIRRLRAGRRSGSLTFPEALRAFAVRYVEHTREGEARVRALAHRLAARQEKAAQLVERIREWALAQRSLLGSAFRKVLE